MSIPPLDHQLRRARKAWRAADRREHARQRLQRPRYREAALAGTVASIGAAIAMLFGDRFSPLQRNIPTSGPVSIARLLLLSGVLGAVLGLIGAAFVRGARRLLFTLRYPAS